MTRAALFAALSLCLSVPAAAQSFRPPDPLARPWATAQINLGPVYFAPTFELSGVGIDNNVFNDEANPKSDLTGTLGMRSLVGIHFGEAIVLQVIQGNSYIWYRRYTSERSIDNNLGATLEWRTRFVRPWVRWERTKTSQRVGLEIDERAERKTPNFDFGADINAAFRLGVSFAGKRSRLRYKDTEVTSDGVNLSETLDNQSDSYQVFLRYQLTDFSDFIVGADFVRDRFSKSPLRDNDGLNYYAGLRMNQGAMFSGGATVGFRQQRHVDKSVPNFNGLTASIDLGVTPSEYVRLELGGGRDIGYSYQEKYPFFVQEGANATITNRFAEHVDLVASAKATWLRYNETITGLKDPHTDRTLVLGVGMGYFVGSGNGTRLGILFERAQRVSPIDARNYVTNRISSNYRFSF